MRDGLCNADAEVEERGELEKSHVGTGYRAKLSAKHLQHATIAGNVPPIIRGEPLSFYDCVNYETCFI